MPNRDLIFWVYIPGQCPSGKNATKKIFDRDGNPRVVPDRRKRKPKWLKKILPGMTVNPEMLRDLDPRTTFEKWRDAHKPVLEALHRGRPYAGAVRLYVDYWWGDEHTRDEPGRSDAIAHLLQNSGLVADDKQLRFAWTYRGVHRELPGLILKGMSEADETPLRFSPHQPAAQVIKARKLKEVCLIQWQTERRRP